MKLETTIKPNLEGRVIAEMPGHDPYSFEVDDDGRLVADVEHEGHIAHLLNTGNFIPVDDADFEAATVIASNGLVNAGSQNDEGDDDEGDDPVDPNAAPIEEPISAVAQTPPASGAKPRAPRAAKSNEPGADL